jgi:hypothetical protein
MNEKSEPIKVQVSPVFITSHQLSPEEFDISFVISVSPLGMSTYTIRKFVGTTQENTYVNR